MYLINVTSGVVENAQHGDEAVGCPVRSGDVGSSGSDQ